MQFRVCLLSIAVALCMGHVMTRGLEGQNKTFSFNLEVISPWDDYLEQLENNNNNNNNATKSELNLFAPEKVTLADSQDTIYTIKVKIGSKKQEFNVALDSGSSALWVYGSECLDTKANCKDHEKFKASDSTTYKKVNDDFEIKYGQGRVKGITAEDTIYFTNTFKAVGQKFGTASESNFPSKRIDGILGLSMAQRLGEGPIYKALKAARMEPIFSIFLKGGGTSANGGEVTFGGVNVAHLKAETKLKVKVEYETAFIVQMDEVKINNKVICTKNGEVPCKALIDCGNTFISGPKEEVVAFNKDVLKATGNDFPKDVKCDDIEKFPDIKIKFGAKTITIEPKFYTLRYSAQTCLSFVLPQQASKKYWTLGMPFLRKFYTEFHAKVGGPFINLYEAK